MKVLGFDYIQQKYRYIAHYKDGKWNTGELSDNPYLPIHEGSTALNYGQECFEGLKAFKSPNGEVNIFRPDENYKRLNESCNRLLIPEIPVEIFMEGCIEVVRSNIDSVPEYEDGGSLYIRPLVIGVGPNLGVKSSTEFMLVVYCSPVGAYFPNGFKPVKLTTTQFDRAASCGTGNTKVGGNYSGSLYPNKLAKENGYADCIYLDPLNHKKIEEVGAANFIGIKSDNKFVTPKSSSILNSITKLSLMDIAKNEFNMIVEERECYIDEVDEFDEVCACGTAAVITPIHEIHHNGHSFKFGEEESAGEVTTKLYNYLQDIQYGKNEKYKHWLVKV